MKNMIDITGVNLVAFVKKVYDLSMPQGLGMLQFQEGGLSDEEAQEIINRSKEPGRVAVYMDYIKGRACKMCVHEKGGSQYIPKSWYDHTDDQLTELIVSILPKDKSFPTEHIKKEHIISCNCMDCQRKRR